MNQVEAECRAAIEEMAAALSGLHIHVSSAQQEQLVRYSSLVYRTNQTTNLTAFRTPATIVSGLLLNSILLAPTLPTSATIPHIETDPFRAVDVGSGAGVPGIPLTILFPHWHLTLVESIGKKAAFIRTAIDEVGLKDAEVVPARAEVVGRDQTYRDRADLCMARAVSPLPSLVELCAPLVRAGGTLTFPKSGDIRQEVDRAQIVAKKLNVAFSALIPVPPGYLERADLVTVLYTKLAETPTAFPRAIGLAQSKPLA